LEAVSQTTSARVSSYRYFRESDRRVVAAAEPRVAQKQPDRIVRIHTGHSGGPHRRFRRRPRRGRQMRLRPRGVIFDNDLFNELVG